MKENTTTILIVAAVEILAGLTITGNNRPDEGVVSVETGETRATLP
jgi:hypothetical protein